MPSSRPRRRATLRAAGTLASVAALALTLTACIGAPAPSPTPTPSSSAEPIFASDEEALAAAEAAYRAFLETSVAVTNDGGTGPERLQAVAIGSALDAERATAERFRDEGLRTAGTAKFTVNDLQAVTADDSRGTIVTLYVCDDIRDLDLLDASGGSLVVEGRVVDIPYTVVIEGVDAEVLRVSEKDLWTRENFCLS